MNIAKRLIALLALILSLPLTVSALDYNLTIDGVGTMKFSLDYLDLTATVIGYTPQDVAADVVIPESVESNGVTFSVTAIGDKAFIGYTSLTGKLVIPNSVITIGEAAFIRCSGFTGDLIIPESVTSIGSSAFANCNGFTGKLIIGNSVTSIGSSAFQSCSGFTGDLTIPESVTSIGEGAFMNCSGFTGDLIIGNSVKTIGKWAFEGCSGFIGSLTIGNSVESICQSAFEGCSGFTGDLTIPESVATIGEWAFRDCSGFTGNLKIGNSVILVEYGTFYGCNGFTGSLEIGNSVTSIGGLAFFRCSGFTGDLTISESVTSIGSSAFYDCSGFTGDLIIPESVTSIESSAFSGCSGFTGTLTIPNSVMTIDDVAFSECDGFTGDLTIGNSVKTIGASAFNIGSITGVTVLNSLPPTMPDNGFAWDIYKNATLKVPNESIEDYKAANGWKQFFNITGLSNIVPTKIEIDLANVELTEGETAPLKAIITPEDATDKSVTWSSSDEYVATVDASGLVTAIKPGKVTITATTANGLTASCEVTVVAKTIIATGLTLNADEVEIVESQTLQLTATIDPEDATDKSVTWSSSDEDVATVSASGFVTAIKPGKATITATTANGLTASCEVTVTAKPAGIDGVDSDDAQVWVEGGKIVAPDGSEVFDLNGRRVKPTGISSGIYLVRVPNGKTVKIRL